jgi:transcriptional regulator with XRE-family HTH domain
MKNLKDINKWLKEKREAKSYNINELAYQSDLTNAVISRIENGVSAITLTSLVKLLKGLESNFFELAKDIDGLKYVRSYWPRFWNQQGVETESSLSIRDLIAFVNFYRQEKSFAEDRLIHWFSLPLSQHLDCQLDNAKEQAKKYVNDMLERRPKDTKPIPYPREIGLHILKSTLIKKSVLIYSDAGTFLRKTREKHKLTLKELDDLSHISRSTLSRIERGELERIKIDDITRLDWTLNAEGDLIAMFWAAARFHASILCPKCTERDFIIMESLIRIRRWMQATSLQNDDWLNQLREDIESYYSSSLDKYYAKDVRTPTEIARDFFTALSPYLEELSVEYRQNQTSKINQSPLTTPLQRIWIMILEQVNQNTSYKMILDDFLRDYNNPDLQGAFRYLVTQILVNNRNLIHDMNALLNQELE